MRPHGRARVSARNPQAFAICDRCGALYNHVRLQWQFQYGGAGLYNTMMLVCRHCLDVPQEQLRSIALPGDPVPILNPRIQDYTLAERDLRTTSGQDTTNFVTGIPVPGGDIRGTTPDGFGRSLQETGEPPGGLNHEPGTDPNAPGNDDPGLPIGFDEVPKTGPLYGGTGSDDV